MTCPSAADAVLELNFGALYFHYRGVLNFGALYFCCRRVLSKAQLAGVQNPDPLVQTGLRIITLTPTLIMTLTLTLVGPFSCWQPHPGQSSPTPNPNLRPGPNHSPNTNPVCLARGLGLGLGASILRCGPNPTPLCCSSSAYLPLLLYCILEPPRGTASSPAHRS